MIKQKQTRFIRSVLYSLKRGYGFPIILHKIVSESLNTETGKRISVIKSIKIKKAIVLPAEIQRRFERDSTSTDFSYGAFYDTAIRKIIIDVKDLDDFKIELNDYFIWDEKRWEVSEIVDLEYQTAYLIIGKLVEGAPRYMIEEVALESDLQLNQEIIK